MPRRGDISRGYPSPSANPFNTNDHSISIDFSSESRTEQYFVTASSIARSTS